MAVNKTLKMSWDGVEYNVLVTMLLIDNIEEDLNLVKLMARAAQNDIRYSHACRLISMLLKSAGCPATQKEIWDGMSDTDGSYDVESLATLLWQIFAVIFPEQKKKETEVKK